MIFKYFIFHAEHIVISLIMKHVFQVTFARSDIKNLIFLSPEVKKKYWGENEIAPVFLNVIYNRVIESFKH